MEFNSAFKGLNYAADIRAPSVMVFWIFTPEPNSITLNMADRMFLRNAGTNERKCK